MSEIGPLRWVKSELENCPMTLKNLVENIRLKYPEEIKDRYSSSDSFYSAIRNVLTTTIAFNHIKRPKNQKGKGNIWFYDRSKSLSRKKYSNKKKAGKKTPEKTISEIPFPKDPSDLFLWYTKEFIHFGL
tara:strand:+ start:5522 stop:5911 length:390 start_codon:yes stop_codon:yes gene_type:complete